MSDLPDAPLPAALAGLDGPALAAVARLIDVALHAGRIDPEADYSLMRDDEAVTMTLTLSVPLERIPA